MAIWGGSNRIGKCMLDVCYRFGKGLFPCHMTLCHRERVESQRVNVASHKRAGEIFNQRTEKKQAGKHNSELNYPIPWLNVFHWSS